ncbi:hypothetical protein [Pseudomonas huanghezhanensis]|uniref:hypothetical protein n=1 Tax=Pseudomonas huanghezhanensis TaxID=3002903 RepID=UPI0022869536|nr:hypothetical protein [Pseudomonas sp. BSw22131]
MANDPTPTNADKHVIPTSVPPVTPMPPTTPVESNLDPDAMDDEDIEENKALEDKLIRDQQRNAD